MTEDFGRRTEEALERAGLADVRPLYRKLLVRLKSRDPGAFAEASRRYESELLPAIAAGADPLAEWLDFGRGIAELLSPGDVVSVDPSGRARPWTGGEAPAPGSLLLQLPREGRSPAVVLCEPREPSECQRETLELLVP